MLANSGPGSQGWGLSTLYMFAILIGVGTCINYFMIPEVSYSYEVTLIAVQAVLTTSIDQRSELQ